MKTMKERMHLFHDNAGPLHKEVDERISKFDKKKAKRVAVAAGLAAAVLVGSLFSGPEDITGSNAEEIFNPTPVVMDVNAFDAADVQDEEPAPEEAKKTGIKARLRAAILSMPKWARVTVMVPLWGLGYALLLLGSFLKVALTPFAGVILSALLGIAAMVGLFGVTAKLLFPDMPWSKIFSKTNLIVLFVTGALLAVADVIVPHYYKGYPYVAAAVKLTAALVVINVLLARLRKFAEKFA